MLKSLMTGTLLSKDLNVFVCLEPACDQPQLAIDLAHVTLLTYHISSSCFNSLYSAYTQNDGNRAEQNYQIHLFFIFVITDVRSNILCNQLDH